MKIGIEGSPLSCEPKCSNARETSMSDLERESSLRSLYVNLCNLIVESRIPGVNERGYGEGVHCPPLTGSSTHCCNLSRPECQKHQVRIQRLLCGSLSHLFDVEVLLFPECCEKQHDVLLSDRIFNKEYILLEQWSLNCCTSGMLGKHQSNIDASQLLRAVRSFLYFSQLSAWLSLNKGKSPTNVYYWIKTPGERISTKFDGEPQMHAFPWCRINDKVYGNVEVKFRTRTPYVPFIACSKHPPATPQGRAVEPHSNGLLDFWNTKQVQTSCETDYQSTKMPSKVAMDTNSKSNFKQMPFEKCSDLNANNRFIYPNGQRNVESILLSICDSSKRINKSLKLLTNTMNSEQSDLNVYENIYSNNSSQKNCRKRQHSLRYEQTECRQKVAKINYISHNVATEEIINVTEQHTEKNMHCCEAQLYHDKQGVKSSNILSDVKCKENKSFYPISVNTEYILSSKRKMLMLETPEIPATRHYQGNLLKLKISNSNKFYSEPRLKLHTIPQCPTEDIQDYEKSFRSSHEKTNNIFPKPKKYQFLPKNILKFPMGRKLFGSFEVHVIFGDNEYYVPKKGAIQVTLFNPCGTVVKMFVVNYDLSNMPPMCHTFIRQKTLYMPSGVTEENNLSQKWLRYIIHLRFASTRTGKIFLFKEFKLVILNRFDIDAATIHSLEAYEFKTFSLMPVNPMFSEY